MTSATFCEFSPTVQSRVQSRVQSTEYRRPQCVVFCDSLPHFDILRVRFQIQLGIPLTFAAPERAGSFSNGRYCTCMMVPLHVDPEAYTSTTVHLHCWSAQTARAIKLAVARNTVHGSCRRTTRVKIFVKIISRMTCNSPNLRKFRPTNFKRYTV